jgi:PTH1 family peptidyl-tRNA hydrolase
MKIVVGLGNPGQKYKHTRHNVGFDVLSIIAQRYGVGRPKAKFNAEVAETIIKNQKTVLISPLTFMNLSGQSVRAALDFFKVPHEQLIIVCDDINLDVGRIRIRPSGSAGGQNGLKDIFQRSGTIDIPRLRLGVGRVPARWDAADFVLGKFDEQDRQLVNVGIERAADAIEVWIESGIQSAMNRFNADPNQKKKQSKTRPSDVPNENSKSGSPELDNSDIKDKDQ